MKTKFILAVAVFTSLAIFSQKKWTLKECVDQALERNISIQQNKLSLELAKRDVDISKGNFLPNLNASTGGNLNFGSSFNPVTNNRQSTTIFGGSVSLSAGYTIFNGYRKLSETATHRPHNPSSFFSRDWE